MSRLNWCFISKSVSGLTVTFRGDFGYIPELRCRDYVIYILYLINFIVCDSFMINLRSFVGNKVGKTMGYHASFFV